VSKSIWRVEWNLAGQGNTRTSTEFNSEDKAVGWAESISAHGATNVVVQELIVGRTIHFNSDKNLFTNK
jgi:hypothetical protein